MAGLQLEADLVLGGQDEGLGAAEAEVTTPTKKGVKAAEVTPTKPSAKKSKKARRKAAASEKKCGDCGRTKPLEDFHEEQANCKDCSADCADTRSLLRLAKAQGVRVTVVDLKKKEPKVYAELFKGFRKKRLREKKEGKKVKFGIAAFITEYRKANGTRLSAIGEMMWEEEYILWAKGPAGFLTREPEANWLVFINEAAAGKRRTDQEGPRGFQRVFAKTTDQGEDYEDVSKSRALQRVETIKKPTEDQLSTRRRLLFEEDGLEAEGEGHDAFNEVLDATQRQGDAAGARGPELEELLQQAQTKFSKNQNSKGKKKTADSEDTSEDEDEGSNETDEEAASKDSQKTLKLGQKTKRKAGKDKTDGEGSKPGQGEVDPKKWYDAETQNLKAEKDFDRSVASLKQTMIATANSMQACLTEFRNSGSSKVGICGKI